VILRGGKALPLYARVVEAGVPRAIVVPAQPGGELQVRWKPGCLKACLPARLSAWTCEVHLLHLLLLCSCPVLSCIPVNAAVSLLPSLPSLGAWLQVELRPQDLSWQAFLGAVPPPTTVKGHVAGADDITGIIFSSGTTGG